MPADSRHKLKLVAVALCSAALLASGCGGDDYKGNVESAAKGFKTTSQEAGSKLRTAKTKEQFAAGVDEFQGAVRTFNSKLQALKPPNGAAPAQGRLIRVLNTFSSDVGAVRDALNVGNIGQIQTLQGKVVADVGEVQSAAKELQDKAG
jgi:hypothetical protein